MTPWSAAERSSASHSEPPSLTRTPVGEPGAQLPITNRYADRTVTLPLFAGMSRSQQDRVVAAIKAALDGP